VPPLDFGLRVRGPGQAEGQDGGASQRQGFESHENSSGKFEIRALPPVHARIAGPMMPRDCDVFAHRRAWRQAG
jgi:hypothetical protein